MFRVASNLQMFFFKINMGVCVYLPMFSYQVEDVKSHFFQILIRRATNKIGIVPLLMTNIIEGFLKEFCTFFGQ